MSEPACVTVTLADCAPLKETVPLRSDVPSFTSTDTVTEPFPEPEVLSRCIQLADADADQASVVVTSTGLLDASSEVKLSEVGETVRVAASGCILLGSPQETAANSKAARRISLDFFIK
jgi:hypothetical protein